MALADTAQLMVDLSVTGNSTAAFKKARDGLHNLHRDSEKLRASLGKIGQGLAVGLKRSAVIGAGAVGILALSIRSGVDSLIELEDVQNATQQALKTTNRVSGQTAQGIRDLSQALEDQTTVDDKLIQKGANLLLTFTHVRKNAFKPALVAALDLNEALGKGPQGLNSTITLVGKALNDPIRGLSTLRRVGVSFTASQERQIKALVASGQTMKAQRIILRELGKEYGGRATAAAKGYRGQMNRLGDAAEDLKMALAGPLLRPLTRITTKLAEFAKSQDVKDGLKDLGDGIASLFTDANLDAGMGAVREGFTFLKDLPWDTIKSGLAFTASIAGKAVAIFNSLPPEIKGGLITLLAANKLTGGLVASGLKDLAGLALKSLTTITAANVTVIGTNVTGGGTGVVPAAGGGGAAGLLASPGALAAVAAGISLAASAVIIAAIPKSDSAQKLNDAMDGASGSAGVFSDTTARLATSLGDGIHRLNEIVFGATPRGGPGGESVPFRQPVQQGPGPSPTPSRGTIPPLNLATPTVTAVTRPMDDTRREVVALQLAQARQAAQGQADALRIKNSITSMFLGLLGSQNAARSAASQHAAGLRAAVGTSQTGIQNTIRSSRPITNVTVTTTVSATAVASGVAHANATNRTHIE